jgi:hypothetical protein
LCPSCILFLRTVTAHTIDILVDNPMAADDWYMLLYVAWGRKIKTPQPYDGSERKRFGGKSRGFSNILPFSNAASDILCTCNVEVQPHSTPRARSTFSSLSSLHFALCDALSASSALVPFPCSLLSTFCFLLCASSALICHLRLADGTPWRVLP